MEVSITVIIIIVTSIISLISFGNSNMMDKLIFYPPAVTERNEWYRFITCGFIHADFAHLIFNMYAFYLFGIGVNHSGVEYQFIYIFHEHGRLLYLLMYIAALAICLIPTYSNNKNNAQYRSLGASGAVSAVVFASILFNPMGYMGLIFIPVYLVSFLFGLVYLAATYYFDKRGNSNINHSAHLWGALFGLVFIIFACNWFGHYPVLSIFLEQLKNFDWSKVVVTRGF